MTKLIGEYNVIKIKKVGKNYKEGNTITVDRVEYIILEVEQVNDFWSLLSLKRIG